MKITRILMCGGLSPAVCTVLLAAWTAASMRSAVAQVAGADVAGQPAAHGELEEITVTAEKREEKSQNVPISINAITAAGAQSLGVTSTSDLAVVAPGVNLTQVSQNPLLYIRGVGTQNTVTGEEGSNPVYVDGIYDPSLAAGTFALNNIDRIEVLKGPQGTLFGRNATGGAINIVTRDPSSTPQAQLSVNYGNYNAYGGSFYGTTGVAPGLAADVAYAGNGQGEGYGRNLFNGVGIGETYENAIRTKWLYTPDDTTKITFSADYDHRNSNLGIAIGVVPGAVGELNLQRYTGNWQNVNENQQPWGFVSQWGTSLRISHDFAEVRAVSMTSYRAVVADYNYDQDSTALPLVNAEFHSRTNDYTQEFQIQSLPGSAIQWVGGAFYLHSNANSDPLNLNGLAFEPAGGVNLRSGIITTNSIAGYGQATIPLGDQTDLTAGVRYTHDHKSLAASNEFPDLPYLPALDSTRDDSKSWQAVTWRGALSHRFSDELMVYGSVSKGYKAGNFSVINIENPVVNPETLYAYELGVKSDLFERRVRLNAALFDYDYKNIQLQDIVQGTQILLNAASAKIKGLDADLEVLPIDQLKIGAGISRLFTHNYTNFPNAPATVPNPATIGGNADFEINASGKQMVHSPNASGNVSAEYRVPTSRGDFAVSAVDVYTTSFAWEPDNRVRQGGYAVLNAALAWDLPDNRYRIRLMGKNLLDKQYAMFFSSSINDSYSPAPPRTYGVAFDATF